MKLIIFGASGKTGTHLVKQALEAGYSVTAFVRDPLKLTVKHEKLELSTGNVIYPQAVDNAVAGHDAVLVALGTSSTGKTTIRSEGTKHIIVAMKKHSVKRLIVMTSMGSHESRQQLAFAAKAFFKVALKNVIKDHELQEDYVRESSLDWVIVRPSGLTDAEKTGSYKLALANDASLKAGRIARADVADFMLKQVKDDSYLGKAVSVTN